MTANCVSLSLLNVNQWGVWAALLVSGLGMLAGNVLDWQGVTWGQ